MSENDFDGTLEEYIQYLFNFLPERKILIHNQYVINNVVGNSFEGPYLFRYGITIKSEEYPYCSDIVDYEDKKVVTTDNEATVSIYELLRDQKVHDFKLNELLINGSIKTGTLKKISSLKKQEILQKRQEYGFVKNPGAFESKRKPYRFLKYAHLLRAKPTFPENLKNPYMALTHRCISPMNIIMTHTKDGNVLHFHKHFEGESEIGEIGESKKYLPAFLYGMYLYIKDTENGDQVFRRYLELGEAKLDFELADSDDCIEFFKEAYERNKKNIIRVSEYVKNKNQKQKIQSVIKTKEEVGMKTVLNELITIKRSQIEEAILFLETSDGKKHSQKGSFFFETSNSNYCIEVEKNHYEAFLEKLVTLKSLFKEVDTYSFKNLVQTNKASGGQYFTGLENGTYIVYRARGFIKAVGESHKFEFTI